MPFWLKQTSVAVTSNRANSLSALNSPEARKQKADPVPASSHHTGTAQDTTAQDFDAWKFFSDKKESFERVDDVLLDLTGPKKIFHDGRSSELRSDHSNVHALMI